MKILVTGAGGLIGSWAAEFYKNKGDEVVGLDNFERSQLLGHTVSPMRRYYNKHRLETLGVLIEDMDVSQARSFQLLHDKYGPFDWILHLAAQCGVPTSIERPRRDFEVNAVGTLNVLEHAREHGAGVVYASTNKVYPIHSGWRREDGRWRWENQNLHRFGWPVTGMNLAICQGTRTPYGTSKYAGDLYCQEYAQMYDMRVGVFRMSCIVGEHQLSFQEQGWVTWFMLANLGQQPITVFGDGQQVRDILHVSDAVRAYDGFITSDIHNGVWNLGGGPEQSISINDCLLAIQETTGKRFKGEVTYEGWRTSDQRCYTSDIRPAMKQLRWRPRIPSVEIFDRLGEWVSLHVQHLI